jgi:hypothetical protein
VKIWNTKYALTSGISEHEAENDGDDGIVRLGPCIYLHGEGREWHRSLKSAAIKSDNMRIAKIDSLRKRIAKLEAMKFEW